MRIEKALALAARLNRTYRWAAFGLTEPKWLRNMRVPITDAVLRETYMPHISAELAA